MSVVFLGTADRGYVNSAHVVHVDAAGVALLTNGCEVVLEANWAQPCGGVELGYVSTGDIEEQLRFIVASLGEISQALYNKS